MSLEMPERDSWVSPVAQPLEAVRSVEASESEHTANRLLHALGFWAGACAAGAASVLIARNSSPYAFDDFSFSPRETVAKLLANSSLVATACGFIALGKK